jgi:hypothetical protein
MHLVSKPNIERQAFIGTFFTKRYKVHVGMTKYRSFEIFKMVLQVPGYLMNWMNWWFSKNCINYIRMSLHNAQCTWFGSKLECYY